MVLPKIIPLAKGQGGGKEREGDVYITAELFTYFDILLVVGVAGPGLGHSWMAELACRLQRTS